MGYWDRLEKVKDMASMLQRCPIPDSEELQQINLTRLTEVETAINNMLVTIAPQVEVWCGDGPVPMEMVDSKEWDRLVTFPPQ